MYKKITTLLFLSIYLFSASTTRELFKLPVLIDHYFAHRDLNSSTTLLSFLVKHYCEENGTDKDSKEDRELPFKSTDSFAAGFFVSIIPQPAMVSLYRPLPQSNSSEGIRNDLFIYSHYLATIWQPPRYC